jgi:hypothetical protein
MSVRVYKTNLNCGGCVAAVKPFLDGAGSIKRWSVDTSKPDKPLKIEGDAASRQLVESLVSEAGFRVLGVIEQQPTTVADTAVHQERKSIWATYYPLLLVFGFIAGTVTLLELRDGTFQLGQAMNWFMGGFFLVFSFFKLLNLSGFVDAYRTYDVLARRVPAYGYLYPFIELLLGVFYLLGIFPLATNIATAAVMTLGLVGVSQALLQKRRIQCACLGTVFNLPMSSVTFFEDALMVVMAVTMLTGTHA